MKKVFLGMGIFVIIFIVLVVFLTNSITSGINKGKEKYEDKIGQKIVLEKDTLTIIDYSSILETFTLSNGKTVNSTFVFSKDSSMKK